MKQLTRICWLLLGVVFIFSGLVKLNDPVGTALKLEEYFEVFSKDFGSFFEAFIPYSRTLSIFLSSLEVVLGVAVLLRWMLRQTLWVLLALLVFFGFLTFYSAAFNKVTDCGCFGDFIKLTPWTSFFKDLFLLVLWAVVFFNQRYLRRVFAKGTLGVMYITLASAVAIGIGVRALGHLPYFDFLPYKEGNDIAKLMKPQEQAKYQYVMERNGETKTFTEYPTDSTWKYKSMEVLNPLTSKPVITDFSIFDAEGKDHTQEVLTGNKLLLIVQDVASADRDRFKDITQLMEDAAKSRKQIRPLIITSSSPQDFDAFRHDVNLPGTYYFADATVLKSMIRSNPGFIVLQNGVVKGKFHYHDIPDASKLETLL
ncbi:putative membrane protein YphA (DoxX/SURF4 family) [Hymenobacter luteus]|uniref:Membrane protein YphA (DoxX/SURF4 family) n=2 Tax=Hymenobacter TaxID=89966 RepID=A0ABR6JTN0_9BACT|nr:MULTISPECIES: BT_3928 family protein [Hymenobacter]MBB4599653.1 putative membrane protein YphA (DoxX/SURF4 family) [Hymenobacter latericoloratus]MBB6058037.1 putative membrane protein YphA (DoxX/SURF4 family) [Hymenobacter luteus]